MRLAGDANWWAPGPMRRFYKRFGISEHVDLDPVPAPLVVPVSAPPGATPPPPPRRARPLSKDDLVKAR
jgi:hypothetical protein